MGEGNSPVFLPGESQGRRSLVAAIYGVTQSRTRLKWLNSIHSKLYLTLSFFLLSFPGICKKKKKSFCFRYWSLLKLSIHLLFWVRLFFFLNKNVLNISHNDFKASLFRHLVFGFMTSCSIVSDSLWPHGLQHARLPCLSSTPRPYSNSCPSSQWCHPTISFSVIPFFSCPQSFPASRSFQMSQFFASGGQNIGISASASVLPMSV